MWNERALLCLHTWGLEQMIPQSRVWVMRRTKRRSSYHVHPPNALTGLLNHPTPPTVSRRRDAVIILDWLRALHDFIRSHVVWSVLWRCSPHRGCWKGNAHGSHLYGDSKVSKSFYIKLLKGTAKRWTLPLTFKINFALDEVQIMIKFIFGHCDRVSVCSHPPETVCVMRVMWTCGLKSEGLPAMFCSLSISAIIWQNVTPFVYRKLWMKLMYATTYFIPLLIFLTNFNISNLIWTAL